MTGFEIERMPLEAGRIRAWPDPSGRLTNWPVVYTLNSTRDVYIGETQNAVIRMLQHLKSPEKQQLDVARIVLDDSFNSSVCLDLESTLIGWFAGDGKFNVLNLNEGVRRLNYPDRDAFQRRFVEIFEALRSGGLFDHDLKAIENSVLFKLSPFKELTIDQLAAVENILEGLFSDLESGAPSTSVIQGEPGTGKTIVGIYLSKLLRDIQETQDLEDVEGKGVLWEFFTSGYHQLLEGLRIGIVVPQQSLRKSIMRVFDHTPRLDSQMVLTPFQVGASKERFDLLIVDEAHRLNRRANQPSGPLNLKFAKINERLFGVDDDRYTQLDWIRAQSNHQILLVDSEQSVRPADLPAEVLRSVVSEAAREHRNFRLATQMRVQAGTDYVGFVRELMTGSAPMLPDLGEYELVLFDDFGEMRERIRERDRQHGLARIVAGYAWEWKSDPKRRENRHRPLNERPLDIEIDGVGLRWNSTDTDWINSLHSREEAGSIHTTQGYDLNYAGVIIGADLQYDPATRTTRFDRARYFDKKGMENNRRLGIVWTDDELLRYVRNIYGVLMTRGVRGTYLYACDPELRAHLRKLIPTA